MKSLKDYKSSLDRTDMVLTCCSLRLIIAVESTSLRSKTINFIKIFIILMSIVSTALGEDIDKKAERLMNSCTVINHLFQNEYPIEIYKNSVTVPDSMLLSDYYLCKKEAIAAGIPEGTDAIENWYLMNQKTHLEPFSHGVKFSWFYAVPLNWYD